MYQRFFFLCCVLLPCNLQAQNLSLQIPSFYGINNSADRGYFYGGAGLSVNYHHPLSIGQIRSSIEVRAIDWGNQASLSAGFNIPYWEEGPFRFSGTTGFLVGLALFRENPLGVWGLDYALEFAWQSAKRWNAFIGLGMRYTSIPAYWRYGKITTVLEIPLNIGFGFRLEKP